MPVPAPPGPRPGPEDLREGEGALALQHWGPGPRVAGSEGQAGAPHTTWDLPHSLKQTTCGLAASSGFGEARAARGPAARGWQSCGHGDNAQGGAGYSSMHTHQKLQETKAKQVQTNAAHDVPFALHFRGGWHHRPPRRPRQPCGRAQTRLHLPPVYECRDARGAASRLLGNQSSSLGIRNLIQFA